MPIHTLSPKDTVSNSSSKSILHQSMDRFQQLELYPHLPPFLQPKQALSQLNKIGVKSPLGSTNKNKTKKQFSHN